MGIIGSLIAGAVLAIIASLIQRGSSGMPWWGNWIAGIGGALIGYWLAGLFGVESTNGVDWIRWLISIVVAVILALFIRTFAVQAFKIPTGSMEPNLLIGDHLLVNKLVYSPSFGPLEDTLFGKRKIERGHVIVFKYPEEPTRDFNKRVIALPGETVEIKNKQVFIDGKPITEEEFEEARVKRVRGYSQQFEGLSRVGGEIVTLWALGLPMDELQRETDETMKVTLQATRDAAKKYVRPDAATLLLVGDAAKIEPGVKELKLGDVVRLDPEGKPAGR